MTDTKSVDLERRRILRAQYEREEHDDWEQDYTMIDDQTAPTYGYVEWLESKVISAARVSQVPEATGEYILEPSVLEPGHWEIRKMVGTGTMFLCSTGTGEYGKTNGDLIMAALANFRACERLNRKEGE